MKNKTPAESEFLAISHSEVTVTITLDCLGELQISRRANLNRKSVNHAIAEALRAFDAATRNLPVSQDGQVTLKLSAFILDDADHPLGTTIDIVAHEDMDDLQALNTTVGFLSGKVKPRLLSALAQLEIAVDDD